MEISNIFKNIKIDKESEIFETIFQNRVLKIERIISNGQSSAPDFWYDQEEIEFVLLLSGRATIEFEKHKTVHLQKGDYCTIDSHIKHRVAFTDRDNPTIWLALFI